MRSLERLTDAELSCVLLPLVVAMRYEEGLGGGLGDFLIRRAIACPTLAMPLFWFLTVERSSAGGPVAMYRCVYVYLRVRACVRAREMSCESGDLVAISV